MAKGAPDYTRITLAQGIDATGTLRTIAVDANGQLYAVIKGTDGVELRVLKVDAEGRIIMVPYGVTTVQGTATVTQAAKDREMQGADGAVLRTIAVDAAGRIIMVPYGVTTVQGTATVTQTAKDREVQGRDGATLRTLAVDANGQLIMVPRGQSGNYMSVDASGFLTTVMKGLDGVILRTVAVDANGKILGVLQGDYAGTLKTLAVDSQGRMLAVLTDPEDVFGNPNYMGAAELAARLGALSRFERRGQIIFQDDFESGLSKWVPASSGDAGTIDLTTLSAFSGLFSVRMLTSTASPYAVQISRRLPYLALGKYGLEAMIHVDGNEDYVRIGLYRESTTVRWRFILELDPVDRKLRYMNSGGTWTDIASIDPVDTYGPSFHFLKLVADLANLQYMRAYYDSYEADLSGVGGNQASPAASSQIYVIISAAGLDSTQRWIRVDNVVVTQNEP